MAASLRDHRIGALRATTCYFPRTLPANPVENLGLAARVESNEQSYALVLQAERFVHAVAIDIDGWLPDDNYLHLEPGETRRVDYIEPLAVQCLAATWGP